MNIINAEKLEKAYTGRVLLDGADFSMQDDERVGIVGVNGTGKSTLLKIVAGVVEPDHGTVTRANGLVMSYLPQQPEFTPGLSVLDAVRQMALSNRHTDAHADGAAAEFEAQVKTILNRLGITDFDQQIQELSGGQRKRAALAAVLLAPSDMLLLDEPTNHLDVAMVEWLEERLRNYRGSLLLITHDRYFLDRVTNRIVEVSHGHVYSYDTNYEGYLELKAERMAMDQASEHTRQNILRKEIAWMQRGARARSTKQKAHIQRYEELRDREAPVIDQKMEMASIGSLSSRMGKTTIELDHVTKAYGDKKIITDYTYHFLRDDRVGFLGGNGCGKTTLMKIITGRLLPDSGTVKIGQTIKIGYYAQEIDNDPAHGIEYMDPNLRVIDYIRNTAEYVHTSEGLVSASNMLDRFLFPPEEQYSLIGKLSGGEKRRLNLLRVLMDEPNVLILDEPTNDLDTETLAILEDFLDSYDGIVITVSHDRYFLDRIVNRLMVFVGDGQIRQVEGGYSDYREKCKSDPSLLGTTGLDIQSKAAVKANSSGDKSVSNPEEEPVEKKAWKQEHKRKFTFNEQKEFDTIEEDITALEEGLSAIDDEMEQNASDFVKLRELTEEKEEKEALLDEKMERWEYLTEIFEEMNS